MLTTFTLRCEHRILSLVSDASPQNRPYHHGDLRAALVAAGYAQAQKGGAAAVRLRAATRDAGVSPAAAYRHFADHEAWLVAVGTVAMRDLAWAIEARQAGVSLTGEPIADARARLIAVGEGYVGFALDSPGAFDVAMFGLITMEHADDPAAAGESGRTPFQLLTDAIADLVGLGAVGVEQADAAAITCWSGVHGFASLATKGPLRQYPRPLLDALAGQLIRGLTQSIAPAE